MTPGPINSNPLGELLSGIIQAHGLAQHIKSSAIQDEAHRRLMARQQHEDSLKEAEDRLKMAGTASEINPDGTVQERIARDPMTPTSIPSGVPGLPDMPVNIGPGQTRQADPARTVQIKNAQGPARRYELPTREQQQRQGEADFQRNAMVQARAPIEAQQAMQAQYGIDVPPELNAQLGLPPGTKHLQDNVARLMEAATRMRKEGIIALPEGSQFHDVNALTTPQQAPATVPSPSASAPIPGVGDPSDGLGPVLPQPNILQQAVTRNKDAATARAATLTGKSSVLASNPKADKTPPGWQTKTETDALGNVWEWRVDPQSGESTKPVSKGKLGKPQPAPQNIQIQGMLDKNPDALDIAAAQYEQTGVMPALGRNGVGSVMVLKRVAERQKAAGVSPEQTGINRMILKANQTAMADVTKRESQIGPIEKTAGKNLDVFLGEAQKLADLKSPLLNKVFRGGERMLTGGLGGFDAARVTAFNEIARVTSMGNGVVSDTAKAHADKILKGDYTTQDLMDAARVLRLDMKNRLDSITEEKQRLQHEMGNGQTAAPHPAATHRFNPATGKIEEIK